MSEIQADLADIEARAYALLTEGERVFVHYRMGTGSHWERAFFKLCENSDARNLARLRNADSFYGELVNAFQDWRTGSGRWPLMRACIEARDRRMEEQP
jgi:hypothetical protein